jgi:hypothetical protein
MAKITGSKTTKAAEAASLKAARTRHRVGVGQLLIQPSAHADREAALLAAAEKVDDDSRAEVAAVNFVAGPAPVQAQAAVSHVRPTARYQAPQTREARCLECQGFHRNGASCAPAEAPVLRPGQELVKVGPQQWTVLVGPGMATEKQAKWMMDIAHRPSITDEMRFSLRVRLQQGFARAAASAFITKYKNIPQEITTAQAKAGYETSRSGAPLAAPAGAETPAPVEVPAGRYAVIDPTDGVFKFFHLDRPTEGRWKGYTFLKVRASDDLHSIRAKAHRDAVIAEISRNPMEAQTQYGIKLGRCYACGRTLTDETSRSLGIGPDCRSK